MLLLPYIPLTVMAYFFFFQAEDGIRDYQVTGVQACALPIFDGRGVLRRRLAADGTTALSIGPSHGRRLDGHLFWSQRRLRLGAGLIKYRFWRWSDKYPFGERIGNSGRCDDATWPRRVGARWYGPVQLKQSARRHCWRSSRFQLASRNGRLRS